MELVYGKNPVKEALRSSRRVQRLYIATNLGSAALHELLELARLKEVEVTRVPNAELTKLVRHTKHQGTAVQVAAFVYASLDKVLADAEQRNDTPLLAFLDGIEDPHNFGAIIRSAEAAGFHGLVIPKDRAVQVTPTVEKTAAGASAYLPIVKLANLVGAMRELKRRGFWFYGISQDGTTDLTNADFSGPTALVLGSEGSGLRRLVREHCDFMLKIPMHGKINSLNVSVAAGIVFFKVREKIGPSGVQRTQ